MDNKIEADVGFACECCALLVSNGDDTQCRDYYGHSHPEADFGGWAVVGVSRVDVGGSWRCDGCGCLMSAGCPATPVTVFPVG